MEGQIKQGGGGEGGFKDFFKIIKLGGRSK